MLPQTSAKPLRRAWPVFDDNRNYFLGDPELEGQFQEQWCAKIKISMSTMYNWANRYPEFDEARQLAWTYLTAYWTNQAILAAGGAPAEVKLLIHILQKRFPNTWGSHPRNTQANFSSRVSKTTSRREESSANQFELMTEEELTSELSKIRSGK